MKINISLVFVCLVAVCTGSVAAFANDSMPLTFYRDGQDQMTEQSKQNADAMKKIADKEGHITLWVMLDIPFNVYMDEMTAEEIATQNVAVAAEFAEVFYRLEANGDIWHPKDGPLIRGPGSAIRANARGLNALFEDRRIAQISATSVKKKKKKKKK